MDSPCPVHEGRRALRGCDFCGRPICPLCELKMRGRVYCSSRCAHGDSRPPVALPLRNALSRPVPPRLMLLAVALGISAPLLLALRTVRELDRLTVERPPATELRRPAARIESVSQRPSGALIEGIGPAGGAVFLFGGSGFVAAAPVVGGRFRFDAVGPSGPYRVGVLALSPEPALESRPRDASIRTGAGAPSPLGAPTPAPAIAAKPPAPPREVRSSGPPTPSLRLASRAARPPLAAPALLPPAAAAPWSRPGPASAFAARAIVAPAAPPIASAVSVPDLTRGPADRPELVLSFDAGSSDRGARQILDALRARGVRTTIFLTGEFIRRYPDIAARIAADGHEVGNHTDTHPHLTTYARDGRQATRAGVDRDFLARQLRTTADAYRTATGRDLAPLWRAPFGEHNPEIRRWAALEGYWHVGWTGGRAGLDGLDWISDPSSRAYRTSDRVVERLSEHAENGGIILLHLGSDREDPVAPRVPDLIDGLSRRGFRLVRASQFLAEMGLSPQRLLALRSAQAIPAR